MNIIQEAQEYAELLSQGYTNTEVAQYKDVPRSRVEHRLSWLDLPLEIRNLVAAGKLPTNVKVAKALSRLPKEYQVIEARRLSQSRAKIGAIEEAVERLLEQLLKQKVRQWERLNDGRPFMAVALAEESVSKQHRRRRLNQEAILAARKVCELCSLQANLNVCKPCPLVTMLSVLIRME
jgi:hypothetical protein